MVSKTETNLRYTVSDLKTNATKAIHKVAHASPQGVHTACGALLVNGKVYYREPPTGDGLVRCGGCYKGESGREPSWHEAVIERIEGNGTGPLYLGDGMVFVVRSSSDPMAVHYIIHLPGQELVCTCKSFRFRGSCSHRKQVVEYLGSGT